MLVAYAEDEVLASLRAVLLQDRRFRLIGAAAGADVLDAAEEIQPDVILVEEAGPDAPLTHWMHLAAPSARVVALGRLPELAADASDRERNDGWLSALSALAQGPAGTTTR